MTTTDAIASVRRIAWYLGGLVLLLAAANSEVRAQFFQSTFGFAAYGAPQSGIIQTRDGNFMAVGSTPGLSGNLDVYVVKSNRCGAIIWARAYDLGGNDVGRKIRLLPDGGFIIVGTTENSRNCCQRNDAFLLKINSDGREQWARTYGGLDNDEGLDVLVWIAIDAPSIVPSFIVAGRSNSFGRGQEDGWLLRIDDNGDLIWGNVYGEWGVDGFASLTTDCQGNIMAAGTTRSFSRGGNEDILVAWVNPYNGQLLRSNVYGSRGDDGAHCIVSNGDQFYVAGYTSTLEGVKGYVMQARCSDGVVLADRYYGSKGVVGDDQFTEVQILPTGNLILTGFLQDAPGGLGGYDVQLTELTPTLGHVFTYVYGGGGTDKGWSVAVAPGRSLLQYNLIVAGFTDSFSLLLWGSFYEIMTTSSGTTLCNQKRPDLVRGEPGFIANPVSLADSRVRTGCQSTSSVQEDYRFEIICTPCRIPDLEDDMLEETLSMKEGSGQKALPTVVSAASILPSR